MTKKTYLECGWDATDWRHWNGLLLRGVAGETVPNGGVNAPSLGRDAFGWRAALSGGGSEAIGRIDGHGMTPSCPPTFALLAVPVVADMSGAPGQRAVRAHLLSSKCAVSLTFPNDSRVPPWTTRHSYKHPTQHSARTHGPT